MSDSRPYGPDNPHPLFGRRTELVWDGKYDEYGRLRPVDVAGSAMPMQKIETVDMPRSEALASGQTTFGDLRTTRLDDFRNLLIWGDNKLVMASLLKEFRGKIDLIYIDPPFDVGADFTMQVAVGEGNDNAEKDQSLLEMVAYKDMWGKGTDSYLHMIYERLVLMRDLLAEDGSIYVHCDWRANSHIRLVCDEIFGKDRLINEIVWKRRSGVLAQSKQFGVVTDTILFYSKAENYTFSPPVSKEGAQDYVDERFKYVDENGRRYRLSPIVSPSYSPTLIYEYKGFLPPRNGWSCSLETMKRWDKEGKLVFPKEKTQRIQRKQYLDEWNGRPIQSLWDSIPPINPQAIERLGYATQKPEALLERIIKASSNEGDLVADFFCGSGTTSAVAEKLGRKWIVSDLGKFGIHTTRKRMIGVQRQLKAEGKDYRAFEILNLGKYERQHYIGVNPNLRDEEKQKQIEEKEAAFVDLILRAYRAEKTTGFETFHGKRAGRLVAVGPINMPVTRLFVEEVILECRKKHITRVDILGFEFEMGLFPNILDEARAKGIDIAPKYIPAEVFDKRAVEKNQVVFHDVAAIEVTPKFKGDSVAVELTDFSVFYSQDSMAAVEASLKNKASKIVVESGKIVKVTKDKDGIVRREVLTQHWTDWIDYWAVDFNFESKREIVRVHNPDTKEWEEVWTGDYIFENEWQSFRTKKDRSLELTSVFHECKPGRRKVAVKVVDIFGSDTMTIIDLNIGGK